MTTGVAFRAKIFSVRRITKQRGLAIVNDVLNFYLQEQILTDR